MSIHQDNWELAVLRGDREMLDYLYKNHSLDIYKDCPKCDESKEIYKFYRRHEGTQKTTKDTLYGWCVSCNKENCNKRYVPSLTKVIQATDRRFKEIVKFQKKLLENNI